MNADNRLELAQSALLTPYGLEDRHVDDAFGALLRGGVDTADLYFQSIRHESWSLEDGHIREGAHSIDQGVGVRAIAEEKTGFAYSDQILAPALMGAAEAASAIASAGQAGSIKAWQPVASRDLYPVVDPLRSIDDRQKVDLLKRVDAFARGLDPRVAQVNASLASVYETVYLRSSDGLAAGDIRPLVRLNISVIVEENGRREQGYSGGGGRTDLLMFTESEAPENYAREAVRQALVNLEAQAAPAGEMVVVLGSGWPGVLLHEAIGHGLEGDFNRKGTSAFTGRVGEKVASEFCTVVDDGTMAGRRGSLNVDDEGTPTQCTTLIEGGKLTGYLQDRLNARLMGVAPTGNGRRQSFAYQPMPRMTNTYMMPGPHDPGDIIASVDKGIYARNFAGGQVDITSGKFVFSTSEAYLIENGKVGAPIKDATLIGDGPSVLQRVSMVGSDLELDQGIGVCGKDGQSVPVGVGQPTLRVDGLTVGGVGG